MSRSLSLWCCWLPWGRGWDKTKEILALHTFRDINSFKRYVIKCSRRMASQQRTGIIGYYCTQKDMLKKRLEHLWICPDCMNDIYKYVHFFQNLMHKVLNYNFCICLCERFYFTEVTGVIVIKFLIHIPGIGMDSSITPLRHGGLSLVQTTDFFYPLVDDPYMMVWLVYRCWFLACCVCMYVRKTEREDW